MAQTGYSVLSLYNSSTTTNVPTAGNLVAGELALNTADGKLFYKDSGGVVQTLATKATGSIGGSTTQVQYNSSGSLAGSANFVFDGTNVGIGVAPSAWGSTYRVNQIGQGASISGRTASNQIYVACNNYVNSSTGNNTYITSDLATQYYQYNGTHVWQVAPSGTAGGTVTFTTPMTLTNAGTLNFGISGQGIQFTNSSALTNSILNDYETGTWTPSISSSTGSITSYTSSGSYTKIGKQVFVNFTFTITNPGTASQIAIISNFPFQNGTNYESLGATRETIGSGLLYMPYLDSALNTGAIRSPINGPIIWTTAYRYDSSISYISTF